MIYLRAKDDLMHWTADVRHRNQHSPTKSPERDLFDMQEERRKIDGLLRGNRLLQRRTVVLHVGLPSGPDFTDPAEDGRDAFMDMWGDLAELALTELRSVVETSFGVTFDLQAAMKRLGDGERAHRHDRDRLDELGAVGAPACRHDGGFGPRAHRIGGMINDGHPCRRHSGLLRPRQEVWGSSDEVPQAATLRTRCQSWHLRAQTR
ncbi:MAG: hypothetical protein ACRDS9_11210 [Pseudonocardiaceae bacterium]